MAQGGMAVPSSVSPMTESIFSSSMQYGGALERDGGSSTTLADGHKISQVLLSNKKYLRYLVFTNICFWVCLEDLFFLFILLNSSNFR